jgi:nucleotide-binding universal stress UspA family protein/hemerythrin-like domain-containing protein
MYRHLLVPIDGSLLSNANVQAAVSLAASLHARITFFHATADLSATGDGALLRSMAPAAFAQEALGDTNAVLVKATVSAHALGVPCKTASRVCDHPAEAIVEAAQEHGCDVIVMASRGARGLAGLFHGSQTERVLRQSPIAVLITRVAANEPLTARERALAVIMDEHRSIVAVVQGLCECAKEAVRSDTPLDVELMKVMLSYLQAFPLQLHHPKEERHLHRWMRLRAPGAEAALQALEQEHQRERELVEQAVRRLDAVDVTDLADVAEFGHQLRVLADAVIRHINEEQRVILPLAKQVLRDGDWLEMVDDFERSNDPGFGGMTAVDFKRLFSQIANLLPAAGAAGAVEPRLTAA